ncbi:lipoprotein, partial [Citrobacter rodentium]
AGPGVIRARQQSRDHVAEVRITYSATRYDIQYESSLNLLASGGKIHKNYNRWVRNLDKDIQLNLSAGAGQ